MVTMKKIHLLLFLLGAIITTTTAQSFFSNGHSSLKSYKEMAKEAFDKGEYSAALSYYERLVKIDSQNIDYRYNSGVSAQLFKVFKLAETRLDEVEASEKASEYPLLYFYLGAAKHRVGKYKYAKMKYSKFIGQHLNDDNYSSQVEEAKRAIEDCDWAIANMSKKKDLDVIPLKGTVNTEYTEFAPFEYDNQLYYSSLRFVPKDSEFKDDMISKVLVSKEEKEGNLYNVINDEVMHTSNYTMSPDGMRIYYTHCTEDADKKLTCVIYYKEKDGSGNFGRRVKLGTDINMAGYNNSMPSLGKDANGRELLFFSSDRPGGVGKMDIWCAIKEEDGIFSAPVNIKKFNTEEDDISPFFHSGDAQVLYYSSEGREGFGGFDIYQSAKLENGTWGPVENMGYPVNSSYEDRYYFINAAGNKAYLSSNREGVTCSTEQGFCRCSDIYNYEIPIKVDLKVLTYNDISKYELMGCTVGLIDLTTNDTVHITNNEGNDFYYPLELERDYKLIATKDLYSTAFDEFTTKGITTSQTIVRKMYLTPNVNLIVYTYDKLDNSPLNGVTVKLTNKTLNVSKTETNSYGNKYDFPLSYGYDYDILGTLTGYSSDSDTCSTVGKSEPLTIVRNLYLAKEVDIVDYPLLPLYFNNDEPNPNTTATTTTISYEQTYNKYYPLKESFKNVFQYEQKEQDNLELFFEDSVRAGYERLVDFTGILLSNLQKGQKIEIVIKGFASPLSNSSYNFNLSERRIWTVKNFFSNYRIDNVKVFENYIANNQLILSEERYGSSKAKGGTNDINDQKNSIFSVAASRERRVEIIEVKSSSPN